MDLLAQLQERITQWKVSYIALKEENAKLKEELKRISTQQAEFQTQIDALKNENKNKNNEIEKIITQLDALLA